MPESAFDPEHPYYDAKWQDRERPRWYNVHVEFRHKLTNPDPVTLSELRKRSESGGSLEHLELFVKPRLSVGKIKSTEWNLILDMAGEPGFHAATPPPAVAIEQPAEQPIEEPAAISAAEVVGEVIADVVEDMASTAAELMGEQTAESMMEEIREEVGEELAQEVAQEIAEEVAEQVEAPIAEALTEEVAEIVAEVQNEIGQPVGAALNIQETPAVTTEGAQAAQVVTETETIETEIVHEEVTAGKS